MDEDWGTEPRSDASKVHLREVLKPRKTVIDYLYDLGRLLGTSAHRHRHTGRRAGPLLSALQRRRTERSA